MADNQNILPRVFSFYSYFAHATRHYRKDNIHNKIWRPSINLCISDLPYKPNKLAWQLQFCINGSNLFFRFSQECWHGNINSICSCERLCRCLRASFGKWPLWLSLLIGSRGRALRKLVQFLQPPPPSSLLLQLPFDSPSKTIRSQGYFELRELIKTCEN